MIEYRVEMTEWGDYRAIGVKDGKEIIITCVSKHSHAVSAGMRWKKRELAKRGNKCG